MHKSWLLVYLALMVGCAKDTVEKSTQGLVPNENVRIWLGCAPNGEISKKVGGCYAFGPLTEVSKYACPNAQAFYNIAQTQTFISECKQKGLVFAIWVEIEMGTNRGTTQDSIEKWMAMTKETIEYMKTSGEFQNDTLEASIATMDFYADELNKELIELNRAGAEKVRNVANDIKNKILETFKKSSDPDQAKLAELRYNVNLINPIIDDYEKQANQQTGLYLNVVKVYDTFRKTGTPVAVNFRQNSLDASATSDYDQLAKIKMSAVETGKSEGRQITDLLFEISELRKSMTGIQSVYSLKITPYKDWMTANNFKTPDLLGVAVTSLDNMTGYLLARKKFTSESVSKLVTGIESRTKALILAKADAATRDTILKEAQTKRMTGFVNTTNAKVADMWKLPTKSKKLNLSYLYPKYEKFAAVLSYEAMCQTVLTPQPPTSWMSQGCILMKVEFSKIKNYLKNGLPVEVSMGVSMMRAAGVDAVMLSQIEQLLAQNQPAEAARWHDAAVMSTEVAQ